MSWGRIKVVREEPCLVCGGTGLAKPPPAPQRPCRQCDGTGLDYVVVIL